MVTINEGTQTPVYSIENAGTAVGIFKLDVGAGSALADFGGTIRDVANITKGTITRVEGGTIGVVGAGTVQQDSKPVTIGTPFTLLGTTGEGTWLALIAAAGAGTYQYVSGVDVVVKSGTVDVAVSAIGNTGSAGAGVLARGQFPAGGGISKNFDPVMRSNTNGTLSVWMGGAGSVAVTIQYWQGV